MCYGGDMNGIDAMVDLAKRDPLQFASGVVWLGPWLGMCCLVTAGSRVADLIDGAVDRSHTSERPQEARRGV